jgi:hypothetical protein
MCKKENHRKGSGDSTADPHGAYRNSDRCGLEQIRVKPARQKTKSSLGYDVCWNIVCGTTRFHLY